MMDLVTSETWQFYTAHAMLWPRDSVLPALERRKGFAKQIDGLTSPLMSAGF